MDTRLTAAIDSINARLADTGKPYRYQATKTKGYYQIQATNGRPWYYPPTYGETRLRIDNALRMTESILKFER